MSLPSSIPVGLVDLEFDLGYAKKMICTCGENLRNYGCYSKSKKKIIYRKYIYAGVWRNCLHLITGVNIGSVL